MTFMPAMFNYRRVYLRPWNNTGQPIDPRPSACYQRSKQVTVSTNTVWE